MFIFLTGYYFSLASSVNTFSANSLNINIIWNFFLGPFGFSFNVCFLDDLIYTSGI